VRMQSCIDQLASSLKSHVVQVASSLKGPLAVLVGTGLFALAVAGCKGDPPPPAVSTTPPPSVGVTTPSATPSSTPVPTSPTPDPATVFAADGVGAYIIGTGLSDLRGRGLVTSVVESELCQDAKGAAATGTHAGRLTFTFRSDRLVAVHTTSTSLVTPSGARVGMTVAQLQTVYGSRGTLITGALGNKAFIVRVVGSGLAIVFYLDSTNTRVASMSGGEAQPLEDAARTGEGC
jgi:hypothetical protein